MNSLVSGPVADVLARLFRQAEQADRPLMAQFVASEMALQDAVAGVIEAEKNDLPGLYRSQADNFLAISPEFGRFLYTWARGSRAQHIVEFGTSMGVSTIHLAAALQDMGGGALIGTEIEPSKAKRARANLAAAGLADLVDVRIGDARETLRDIDGEIDMVLLDGAFTLYLDVLKLIEPRLKVGALIIAENAFDQADGYLDYVRNPANGYCSQPLALDAGRGNEFTVVTRPMG
jgi:predicted O-methyltransferase YrrM